MTDEEDCPMCSMLAELEASPDAEKLTRENLILYGVALGRVEMRVTGGRPAPRCADHAAAEGAYVGMLEAMVERKIGEEEKKGGAA